MIRLFVGVELPAEVRQRLAALGGGIPNARWVPEENLHLTLRFIGNVDEGVADEIAEALGQIGAPPFAITLAGFDTFKSGRHPHALWVGVERQPALSHLRDKVESVAVRCGLEPERRKFTPHVTVARLKDPAPPDRLQRFLAENGLFKAGPFPVEHFTLFSSHLSRNGAIYTVEATYGLDHSKRATMRSTERR